MDDQKAKQIEEGEVLDRVHFGEEKGKYVTEFCEINDSCHGKGGDIWPMSFHCQPNKAPFILGARKKRHKKMRGVHHRLTLIS